MPDPSYAAEGSLDELLGDYQARQAEVWDRRADGVFERWRHERGDFELLGSRLPDPLDSVLDLGVGYGRLWPVYRHAGRIAGVDISARMLELARRVLPPHAGVEFVRAPLWELPFQDGAFGAALSVRTLNHLHPKDLPAALQEIHRVCAGRLILLEARCVAVDPRLEFQHDYPGALVQAGFTLMEHQRLDGDGDLLVAHT